MPHPPTPAAIPAEAALLIERYRTCELVTVNRAGDPIAWPVSGILEPATGTFLVTTSLAFPQKALNLRRDPRVAALFSDATGSGLDRPDRLLLQGTAAVADDIDADFRRSPELWRRLLTIQPSSRAYASSALTRRLMDVYYLRLAIDVAPAQLSTQPAVDASAPLGGDPSHELTRRIAGEWRHHSSAVLAAFDARGTPVLTRVVPRIDGDAIRIDVPAGIEVAPGRASLLTHRHDRKLAAMRSANVVGELVDAQDGWVLRPERLVPGQRPVGPTTLAPLIRSMRAEAERYLARRALERPAVDWAALARIAATVPDQRAVPSR